MRRLLVGDDGSEGSSTALAWAEGFASALGGTATSLHVPRVSRGSTTAGGAQAVLSPVPALLDAGHERGADLIVVGRRGSGGFDSLALGSTAHQLAEHSDRPVVVVPTGAVFRWPFATIAVGHDGSAAGDAAMSWTVALAKHSGSHVAVIHAIDLAPAFAAGSVSGSYEATRARVAESVDRDWCAPLRSAGVDYSTVVEEGGAAGVLLAAVRSRGADLLVVGRQTPSSFPGLAMGSVAHRALGFAPCPTVVVPSEPAGAG